MDEKIFDRVEKKYLITKEQKTALMSIIDKHMQHDGYFTSEVHNIYFDTDHFDLIIKSIERPKFKEKLRARSYGGYDKVFLEIKTKMKGKDYNIGYKRRILITHKDYEELVKGTKTAVELASQNVETPHDVQIASEVDYFIKHFNLKPQILVYYDRTSFTGENNLRITFDEHLSYRNHDVKFNKTRKDYRYFKNDEKNIIMEIKAHGVMPLWLVHALSEAKAYPEQFSKIGKIYAQINRKEQNV
ncbi:polyphosphate polymerase domain-containing protein [Candidatus Saccharibacteria bacterium]|nr:polyphosphate polymerase domain-containing protein [Candidatus Saccharibacteria bacterium]